MMHDYSYDSDERRNCIVFLLIISMIAGWIVGLQMNGGRIEVFLPWYSEFRLALLLFGLSYAVFNRHLWKVELIRNLSIGQVTIPNLNGTWKGSLTSSYDEHKDEYAARIVIRQTWTKISVQLETEGSKSVSEIAAIRGESSTGYYLEYSFRNEPKSEPASVHTMNIHYGTARLRIGNKLLQGDYYTGRGRNTSGGMKLPKEC